MEEALILGCGPRVGSGLSHTRKTRIYVGENTQPVDSSLSSLASSPSVSSTTARLRFLKVRTSPLVVLKPQ